MRNARLNFKEQKEKQERKSLENINDFFKKIIIIIIVKYDVMKTKEDKGIVTISLKNFLLDEDALNY